MLTVGSLFAGIGGFDLGFERAGFEIKWQVEIDPFCRKVLEKHWPHVRRYEDVRAVCWANVEYVDVLCGGFPCQPVALGGRKLRQRDARWLWPHFEAAIRIMGPRYVVVENVPGLRTGGGMDDVLGDLAALGFDAEWESLPAATFGAPHIRDRVWIVAYPSSLQFRGQPSTGLDDARYSRSRTVSGRASLLADAEREQRHERAGQSIAVDEAPPDQPRRPLGQWESEPAVGRVVNGVPYRLDRLSGLGNAIVPQIAEWIARRILEAEAVTA